MSDQNNGGPPADATSTATVTDTASSTTTTTTADSTSADAWKSINPKEIVGLRQEQRKTIDLLEKLVDRIAPAPAPKAEPPKPVTADAAAAMVGERLAELDFREALVDAGITGEKRDVLKLAWIGAGRPRENIGDWLKGMSGKLGGVSAAAVTAPAPAPAAPAPAPEAPKVPNLGAPGVDRRPHLPADITKIPGDVARSMSREDLRDVYQGWKRSNGGSSNVFAEKRLTPLIPKKG